MTPDPSSPAVALPAPAGVIRPGARVKPDIRLLELPGPGPHGDRHQPGLVPGHPAVPQGRAQSLVRGHRPDRPGREHHLVADPAALRLSGRQDGAALAAAAVGAALRGGSGLPGPGPVVRRGARARGDHRLRGGRLPSGGLPHRHRGGGRPQGHRRLDLLHWRQHRDRAGPAAAHGVAHRVRPARQPRHAGPRAARGRAAHRGAASPVRARRPRWRGIARARRAPRPWWAR